MRMRPPDEHRGMCCAPRTTRTRHARCAGATRCARQGRFSFTLTSHLSGRADQTSPPRGKRERLSQARLERYTPTWSSNRGPLPACLLTRPAHQLLRAGCALGQGQGSGARGTGTRQDEGNCRVRRELEERGHEATHEDRGALAAHGLDKAVAHTRVERLLAGCGLGHVLHARLDDVERVRHTCSCVRHTHVSQPHARSRDRHGREAASRLGTCDPVPPRPRAQLRGIGAPFATKDATVVPTNMRGIPFLSGKTEGKRLWSCSFTSE